MFLVELISYSIVIKHFVHIFITKERWTKEKYYEQKPMNVLRLNHANWMYQLLIIICCFFSRPFCDTFVYFVLVDCLSWCSTIYYSCMRVLANDIFVVHTSLDALSNVFHLSLLFSLSFYRSLYSIALFYIFSTFNGHCQLYRF